jgi:branched-chain amino acid transport system substrate-binding protein
VAVSQVNNETVKRRKSNWHFIIGLLLAFSAFAPANAAEPIRIGLSLSLTGKYAEISDMQMKAYRLWEKDVNQRGGILGRKVSLVIYDDGSNPRTARTAYEHLLTIDKVDLLFAPYSSELTEAILPLTEEYAYPVVASGSSEYKNWQEQNSYLFGIYTPSDKYTVGFLEILTQHGFSTVAIAYAKGAFPEKVAYGARDWAERFGLRVLFFSGMDMDTDESAAIAKRAKLMRAEALIVCGYFREAVDMRLALKKIGWYPKAYYATVGPALDAYHKKLGADANYTFSSSQWEHQRKLPGSMEFFETFVRTYGMKPSYHAASAFAAGEILEAAIRKAGALNRVKIREVLSLMETMTIMGRYGDNRKTGKPAKQFPLVIQNLKGKKEIVWPEDARTSAPVFR